MGTRCRPAPPRPAPPRPAPPSACAPAGLFVRRPLCSWVLGVAGASLPPVPGGGATRLGARRGRDFDEAEEERSGLVCKHAYAVLDVVEACGRRLVKLKNPWSHVRWKGDFSPGDERNWTPELKVLAARRRPGFKASVSDHYRCH